MPGLTIEEQSLLMNAVRAAPDALLVQIVQSAPKPILIQVIGKVPLRGDLDSIDTITARLKALQKKLEVKAKK